MESEPRADLQPGPRTVLGVDFGTVRIGLALALPGGGLIVPLDTLAHPGTDPEAADKVAAVVRARDADEVVVGDPVHMDGAESDMSRRARAFAELLRARIAVDVHLQDERLTSQEAERRLRESGLHWTEVDKGRIDAVSAMGILEDWFQVTGRSSPNQGSGELDPLELPEPPPGPRSRRDRRRDERRRRS